MRCVPSASLKVTINTIRVLQLNQRNYHLNLLQDLLLTRRVSLPKFDCLLAIGVLSVTSVGVGVCVLVSVAKEEAKNMLLELAVLPYSEKFLLLQIFVINVKTFQ